MLFNCSNVIFRLYVYNDATPRQTGSDILKAMVVDIGIKVQDKSRDDNAWN
jgi:hypothetical protein